MFNNLSSIEYFANKSYQKNIQFGISYNILILYKHSIQI